ADRVERVVEVGPAWHAVRTRIGAERPALGAPAGDGRLRLEDFLGRHAREPVVSGVERAYVLEAQPAPLARPVEARPHRARRAEFARLGAAGRLAAAPAGFVAAMELVRAHSF